MAKIKYNVKGVDPNSDFDPLKPGLYQMKIKEVNAKQSKQGNQMLEVVMSVSKGKEKGRQAWHYIVTEEGDEMGARRLKQLIDALGLKDSGTLDTDAMVGEEVQVLVGLRKDKETGEDRTNVRKVMALAAGEDDEDEDEDEEESEPDEDEDEDEEEDEEDEDEDEDEVDLDELDRKQLKEFIKNEGLAVKILRKDSDDDLRAKIQEELNDDEDEDDDNYDELSGDDLKAELKKRELSTSGTKAKLIARLRKDDEEEPF